MRTSRWVNVACLVFVVFAAAAPLWSQEVSAAAAPPPPEKILNTGHTAWMLVASALVLLMTPGLALFYGGMVRSKNVLGTMMHSMFCMSLVTVLWVICGYSIAFGPSKSGLCGGGEYFLLAGIGHNTLLSGYEIPLLVHMCFQMMFAIITPALISGAYAERIRFGAFALFTGLWLLLVYCPVAHWVWGGGILSGDAEKSWVVKLGLTTYGAMDFAGGTVVHISSGVSALVFALFLGKRKGYPNQPMAPHNLPLTVLGAGLLWFGWYGFNGGSGFTADGIGVNAFAVTHICAASAAFSWAVVEWLHRGKVSVLGVATGLVAGLVCITPASGFVYCGSALVMGLIVSPVCYLFVAIVKKRLGYDDSLDAFGVHGIGGTVGALLTGVFCTTAIDAKYIAGGPQLAAQGIAVAMTWVYAGVVTLILLLVIDKTVGVRVREDDEEQGLDVSQHGESGYSP
jgi:Amt family ammonium transporter